jgi:hypothetical protein
MTWNDFLRYTKFIAVFYAIAFALVLVGIWLAPSDTGWKFFWSGVVFGVTSAVANICLGIYHSNHKAVMVMAKNDWLEQRQQPQVIASESKELDYARKANNEEIEILLRAQIRKALRDERGY